MSEPVRIRELLPEVMRRIESRPSGPSEMGSLGLGRKKGPHCTPGLPVAVIAKKLRSRLTRPIRFGSITGSQDRNGTGYTSNHEDMIQSPTYIHFRSQWQIVGPDTPGQLSDRKRFQDFMSKLNAEPIRADFDDFSYRSDRCEMGKLRGNHPQGGPAFSKLVYHNNQLTVAEEWAEMSANEFKEKFSNILKAWFELFPNTVAVSQNCSIRALIQPSAVPDSRDFIGTQILRLREPLTKTFTSMPYKIGFTIGCVKQIHSQQLFIDTTVNSWRDNKTVWVEVNGASPMEKPINATNPEVAKQSFDVCKTFLEDEVVNLLNTFDTQADSPEEG